MAQTVAGGCPGFYPTLVHLGFVVDTVPWHGSTVVKVPCYKSEGRFVRSQLVSLEFFIDIKSFRSHYGPGVDGVSNRNEYQEHFLGVKAAGA